MGAAIAAKLREQGHACAYTGEKIVLGVNDSLDHIYPARRFPHLRNDPKNVEWVTRLVNTMKTDLTREEFLTMIGNILQRRHSTT